MLAALLYYFFLPHEKNNHRARILQPVFIALSLIMFLGTQFLVPFLPRVSPVVLGYSADIVPEAIIELTNQKRSEKGILALTIDPKLTQAALLKASDMIAKDYWAHIAPDGTEPWYFFTSAQYQYRYAGENLARDFSSPESVVSAWMASPSHRDNLLAARYRDIGVAIVQGDLNGVRTTLVVQFLGTKIDLIGGAVKEGEAAEEEESAVATFVPEGTPREPIVAGTAISPREIFIAPFTSTKRIAIFFVSLFFTILSIDMVIIRHRNVARRSSRSFAHLLFFGMILAVLVMSQGGIIL